MCSYDTLPGHKYTPLHTCFQVICAENCFRHKNCLYHKWKYGKQRPPGYEYSTEVPADNDGEKGLFAIGGWIAEQGRSQIKAAFWGVYKHTRPKRCPQIWQEIARRTPPQVRFITDIMKGEKNMNIEKFTTKLPVRFKNAAGPCNLNGFEVEIDHKTGKATSAKQVILS